jgi:hypothetical protein
MLPEELPACLSQQRQGLTWGDEDLLEERGGGASTKTQCSMALIQIGLPMVVHEQSHSCQSCAVLAQLWHNTVMPAKAQKQTAQPRSVFTAAPTAMGAPFKDILMLQPPELSVPIEAVVKPALQGRHLLLPSLVE